MTVTEPQASRPSAGVSAVDRRTGDPVGAADSRVDADAAGAATAGTVDPEVLRRRWELVLLHRDELLAIARRRVATREDAEDVVTTALVRTVEHPNLDESRIGAFLTTTVMRLVVDVHRDRDRQLAVAAREAIRAVPSPPVDELVCDHAEARWLADQLQHLPQRERQVLEARLSGMTSQQASAHLGLTAKATQNALTRLRRRAEALLAATLAGLGILLGAGRRLTKPEIALVPAGIATALTLAVVVSGGEPPAPPPAAGTTLEADARPADAAAAETASGPGMTPATAAPAVAADLSAKATGRSQSAPAAEDAGSSPARTEVTAPPVVEEHLGPGSVYLEERHQDETFEQSVQRCLKGAQQLPADPLADPCR